MLASKPGNAKPHEPQFVLDSPFGTIVTLPESERATRLELVDRDRETRRVSLVPPKIGPKDRGGLIADYSSTGTAQSIQVTSSSEYGAFWAQVSMRRRHYSTATSRWVFGDGAQRNNRGAILGSHGGG